MGCEHRSQPERDPSGQTEARVSNRTRDRLPDDNPTHKINIHESTLMR